MTRLPIRSLRARLLLSVIVGMVVLQVVSSAIVYVLQSHALYERFDQTIASTAKALAPLVKYDKPKGVHFDVEKSSMPEFQRAKGPDYFQVWRADGSVVARSETLGEGDLARVAPAAKPAKYGCDLPRNEPGRAVQITFELPQKGPPEKRDAAETITLVVAKETKPVRNDLRTLALILTATSLAGALAAGGLAMGVVLHGLRPLHRVATQINDLQPSALGQRIDPSGLPTEMQPVAQRLNQMLERLQAAFERERGFTADVAHEFRNPLAAIRSVGEVALSSPQTPEEYREDITQMVALSKSMQALVEKLLLLARLDAGQVPLQLAPADLKQSVDSHLRGFAERIVSRQIVVDTEGLADATVIADEDLLQLVLRNAIENAVDYVDSGGRVTISLGPEDGKAVVSISNSGCSLDPASATRVFERFWRADTSRSATGVHAGLGLSLVQRATAMMGGTAEVHIAGGRFTLQIRLPAR